MLEEILRAVHKGYKLFPRLRANEVTVL